MGQKLPYVLARNLFRLSLLPENGRKRKIKIMKIIIFSSLDDIKSVKKKRKIQEENVIMFLLLLFLKINEENKR